MPEKPVLDHTVTVYPPNHPVAVGRHAVTEAYDLEVLRHLTDKVLRVGPDAWIVPACPPLHLPATETLPENSREIDEERVVVLGG